MKTLSDTSPEAERVLTGVYRAMSPARKWAVMGDLYRMGRDLHAAGVRLRNPGATPAEIRSEWISTHLGEIPRISTPEEPGMDQPIDNLRVVREVIAAFDTLGVAYALGGSLASGIHGITRYTSDADLSVEPFDGLEGRLVAAFGPDYYVSIEAVRRALRDRSTFNIINTSLGFKVDVFVRKDRPFERSLMRRRVSASMADAPRSADLRRQRGGHHPPQAGVVSPGRRDLRAAMAGRPRRPPHPGRAPRRGVPRPLGGRSGRRRSAGRRPARFDRLNGPAQVLADGLRSPRDRIQSSRRWGQPAMGCLMGFIP